MSRDLRNPVISTASVELSFTPGFSGVHAQFDAAKLVNVWRVPIEVRELRVMIESRSEAFVNPSPFVALEAKLGKHYMTDGAVPISIMAPFRVRDEVIATANSFEYDNAGVDERTSMRRIVLPTPLVLPPGLGFMATASILPHEFMTAALFDTEWTAVVHLSMVGRFLSPSDSIPKMNRIPIISHVELSQTKRISLENNLRNPLSDPIRVHRMIGAAISATTTSLGVTYDTRDTAMSFHFPDDDVVSESGFEFTRLFGQCHLWPISFDMPKNSRIRAQIAANTNEAIDTDRPIAYQFALFGTRPEVIS